MDKKLLKICTLVGGCLAGLVALFLVISGIIGLTGIGDAEEASGVIKLILFFALDVAMAVCLCLCTLRIVKGFLAGEDKKDVFKQASLVYFCFATALNLFGIIFGGYSSASSWVVFILEALGLACVIVIMFTKLDEKLKGYLLLGAFGWGIVVAIVHLCLVGGLSIALYIFVLLMFMAFLTREILGLVKPAKKEAKKVEEKKEEEPKEEK